MALMAPTARAMIFGARHHEGKILFDAQAIGQRFIKAWPAGATFIFALGGEERLVAGRTDKGALPMLFEQGAGKGRFGRLLEENGIGIAGQELLPLRRRYSQRA